MAQIDRIFGLELFTVLPPECVTKGRLGFYPELLATLVMPLAVLALVVLIVSLHRGIALRYHWQLADATPGWPGLQTALNHPRVYKLLTWVVLIIYPILSRKPLAAGNGQRAVGGKP